MSLHVMLLVMVKHAVAVYPTFVLWT